MEYTGPVVVNVLRPPGLGGKNKLETFYIPDLQLGSCQVSEVVEWCNRNGRTWKTEDYRLQDGKMADRQLGEEEIVDTPLWLVHKNAFAADPLHMRAEMEGGIELSVIPNPRALRQDVQACSLLANLLELIDNSLSALSTSKRAASRISVMLTSGEARGPELIIEDNGHGMSKQVLRKVMTMGYTFSADQCLERTKLPLAFHLYINNHFNRHGRGTTSVLYFGDHVRVESKEPNTADAWFVEFDYKEWVQAFERDPTQSYKLELRQVVWNSAITKNDQGMTRIIISDLQPEVLAALQNPAKVAQLRAHIGSMYHFHLKGLDLLLAKGLPRVVKQGREHLSGYVTLNLFGEQLPVEPGREGLSTLNEPPALEQLLDAARKLWGADNATDPNGYRKAVGVPPVAPFVLPVRYVPHELEAQHRALPGPSPPVHIELEDERDETDEQQDKVDEHYVSISRQARGLGCGGMSRGPGAGPSGAAAHDDPAAPPSMGRGRSKDKGASRSAPATPQAMGGGRGGRTGGHTGGRTRPRTSGQEEVTEYDTRGLTARAVDAKEKAHYIDFLLILFYFPVDGDATKPVPDIGTIPVWSGRVMPDEALLRELPALVASARELGERTGEPGAARLDKKRIAGLVMISPECKSAFHKTSLRDAVYDEFMQLGAKRSSLASLNAPAGTLHVFDADRKEFVADPEGELASGMLLHHFRDVWRQQDDEGALMGQHWDVEDDAFHATCYLPPKHKVEHATQPWPKQIKQGHLVRLVGNESQGMEGDAKSRGKNPHQFHYIVEFKQPKQQSMIFARLKPWRPSWSTGLDAQMDWKHEVPISRIKPCSTVLGHEENADVLINGSQGRGGKKTHKGWEVIAPHHLAWEVGAGGSSATTIKTTVDAAKASVLHTIVNVGTKWNNVTVVLATQDGSVCGSDTLTMFRLNKDNMSVEARLDWRAAGRGTYQEAVWSKVFPFTSSAVFNITGFGDALKQEGEYRLVITPQDTQGYMLPVNHSHLSSPQLVHIFKVEAKQLPATLTAHLGVGEQRPVVRVGMQLPDLVVRLFRGTEQGHFPGTAQELLARLRLEVTFGLRGLGEGGAGTDAEQLSDGDSEGVMDGEEEAGTSARQVVRKGVQVVPLRGKSVQAHMSGRDLVITGIVLQPKLLKRGRRASAWRDTEVVVVLLEKEAVQSVGLQKPAPPGAQVACSLPLAWRIASGPAAQLQLITRPLPQNVSQGSFLVPLRFKVLDRNGIPFYNDNVGGAELAGRRSVRAPARPHAVLHFRGLDLSPATGTWVELAEDGMLDVPGDRFVVAGSAGSGAQVGVSLVPESFQPGLCETQAPTTVVDVTISEQHITFIHPSIDAAELEATQAQADLSNATAARGESSEGVRPRLRAARQATIKAPSLAGKNDGTLSCDGVVMGVLLDLLPYNGALVKEHRPRLTVDQWGSEKHDVVVEGLEERGAGLVLVRPNGYVFKGPRARERVCEFVEREARTGYVYEAVLILGHTVSCVDDIRIQICDHLTDAVDNGFCAPLKILLEGVDGQLHNPYGNKRIGWERGMRSNGNVETGAELPTLKLPSDGPALTAFAKGAHTVAVHVVDATRQPTTVQELYQLPHAALFGTFFLRLAPHPCSLALLPLGPAFWQQAQAGRMGVTLKQGAPGMPGPGGTGGEGSPVRGAMIPITPAGQPLPDESGVQGHAGLGWEWAVRTDNGATEAVQWWADSLVVNTPLEVQAGKGFMVYFVLYDQLGIPMRASQFVQECLKDAHYLKADPSGASRRFRASMNAVSYRDTFLFNLQGPGGIPVHALSLEVQQGTGQAELRVCVDGLMACEEAEHTKRNLSASIPLLIKSGPLSKITLEVVASDGGLRPVVAVEHPPWHVAAATAAAPAAPSGRGRKRAASTLDGTGCEVDAAPAPPPQQEAQGPSSQVEAEHASLLPAQAAWCEVRCEEGAAADVVLHLRDAHEQAACDADCKNMVLRPLPGWHAGIQLLELQAAGKAQPLSGVGSDFQLPGGGKATSRLRIQVPRLTPAELAVLPPQRLLIGSAVGPLGAGSTEQEGAQAAAGPAMVLVVTVAAGSYPAVLVPFLPQPVWGHLATPALVEGLDASTDWVWSQGGQLPGHQAELDEGGTPAALVYDLSEYAREAPPLMPGFALHAVTTGGVPVTASHDHPPPQLPSVTLRWVDLQANRLGQPASTLAAQWTVGPGGVMQVVVPHGSLPTPTSSSTWRLEAQAAGLLVLQIGHVVVKHGPASHISLTRKRSTAPYAQHGTPRPPPILEVRYPQRKHNVMPPPRGDGEPPTKACVPIDSVMDPDHKELWFLPPCQIEVVDAWGNLAVLPNDAALEVVLQKQVPAGRAGDGGADESRAGTSSMAPEGMAASTGGAQIAEWVLRRVYARVGRQLTEHNNSIVTGTGASASGACKVESQEGVEGYFLCTGQPPMRLMSGAPWVAHMLQEYVGVPANELLSSCWGPPSLQEGGDYVVCVRCVVPSTGGGAPAAVLPLCPVLASFTVSDKQEMELRVRVRDLSDKLRELRQKDKRLRTRVDEAEEEVHETEQEVQEKETWLKQATATQPAQDQRYDQLLGSLQDGAWQALPGFGTDEEPRPDGADIRLFNMSESERRRGGSINASWVSEVMTRVAKNHQAELVGPLGCLIAFERAEVAHAIQAYYLTGKEAKWVAMSDVTARAVVEFIRQQDRGVDAVNLLDPGVASRTYAQSDIPSDMRHPQQPLMFEACARHRPVCEVLRRMGTHFVGWAVNLAWLPPGLMHLTVPAPPGQRGYNLRQSLLYNVFGRLLIFTDEAALIDFKAEADQRRISLADYKLLALDGAMFGLRGLGTWSAARKYDSGVVLASVPRALQARYPIDTTVASIAVQLQDIEKERSERLQLAKQVEEARNKHITAINKCQEIKKELVRTEAELSPQVAELEAQLARDRATLAALNSTNPNAAMLPQSEFEAMDGVAPAYTRMPGAVAGGSGGVAVPLYNRGGVETRAPAPGPQTAVLAGTTPPAAALGQQAGRAAKATPPRAGPLLPHAPPAASPLPGGRQGGKRPHGAAPQGEGGSGGAADSSKRQR